MDGRLYIVSGKQTRQIAEEFEQLVDASDLPVAGERTELWSVREYLNGAAALPPEDCVVFVGAADAWADETAGGTPCIDRYGMRCVRKGRRAELSVSEQAVEGRKARRDFLAYLRASQPDLDSAELDAVEAERKIALFDSMRAVLNPIGVVMEQQIIAPAGSADLTEMQRLQYRALIRDFVRDVLPGWTD